jgi:hypothetical protein
MWFVKHSPGIRVNVSRDEGLGKIILQKSKLYRSFPHQGHFLIKHKIKSYTEELCLCVCVNSEDSWKEMEKKKTQQNTIWGRNMHFKKDTERESKYYKITSTRCLRAFHRI